MLTDRAIIDLYFRREEQAIQETEQKYGTACTRIAHNILKDSRDAEESVSDTWLAAWNTIPPQDPDPLRAYLFRIVRNIATDRYHRNTARKRDSSYDVALDELEEVLAAPSGVEDHLDARELTDLLNVFLAGLDREDRVLFVRRYWYGEAVNDLARQFCTRPNTLSVRLRRLREKLRKELEKEGVRV